MKAIKQVPEHYKFLITWTLFPFLLLVVGKNYSCTHGMIFHPNRVVIHGRVIAGQVTESSEKPRAVSGAEVLLAGLRDDGELEMISDDTVPTNEGGYFKIITSQHQVRNIILIATKGHQEWRGMVQSENTTGDDILAEPISYETTIATHLCLSALRAGQSEMADYSGILESIRVELALMGYANGPEFARETSELETLESKRLIEAFETP